MCTACSTGTVGESSDPVPGTSRPTASGKKNERHRPDNDNGYDGVMRGRGMCDSKYASYHPYNDIVNYWGMKDTVGVPDSLGLADQTWRDEVKDY